MRKITFLTMLFGLFSILAKAQDAVTGVPEVSKAVANVEPSAVDVPVATEETKELPFDISGFVDVYYQYSFIESPFSTSFTDTHNSFTLGMANLVISREGKVGFKIDLAVGPRAEAANGFTGTSLSAIKQLYVAYKPVDWVTLTLGNFSTFVGYELIDSPDNANYSTSYLFSNGPFYHTGLKADFALSEFFGFMAGVFNDTDSKFDFTPGKHIGGQLYWSNGDLNMYLNYIGGRDTEGDSLTLETTGHQVDFTATYQVTDKLKLGLNAAEKINVAKEAGQTQWFGAAMYANYTISNAFTLGFRGEFIDDPDGVILGAKDGNIIDLTLSGNLRVGKSLILIPEFRIDMASQEVFPKSDGTFSKTSPAVIFAAIYDF